MGATKRTYEETEDSKSKDKKEKQYEREQFDNYGK